MVEIDIPQSTYAMLELIALAENMMPEAVIESMIANYKTKDERELIARSTQRATAATGECTSTRVEEALHAVGIGEPGGSSTGRKLDYWVAAARDDDTGEIFASFGIHYPNLIFRVAPEQVRALVNDLTEIANTFERWSRE